MALIRGGGILWKRLDRAGHEAARLAKNREGWDLSGTAVFVHERQPCRLDYAILCDPAWRTSRARVEGFIGSRPVHVAIVRDTAGSWSINGSDCPDVGGAVDIDLNFSPSTNLLPIRRLDLAVGDQAEVLAAWLRFPTFALEPLEQSYRRLSKSRYRYQSAGGQFTAELDVNSIGLVTLYPGLCEAEAPEMS